MLYGMRLALCLSAALAFFTLPLAASNCGNAPAPSLAPPAGLSRGGQAGSGATPAASAGAAGAGAGGGGPWHTALCEAARRAGPAQGLPRVPWACYVESESFPEGCATCYVLLPPGDPPLARVAPLTVHVPGTHAEMVRSPDQWERAAGKRRAALVADTQAAL